ncbi:hypothetical protein BHE90_012946 [Fusarium euwallaceae]|uniref:Uncharacterized protein n=1 Tax=Fusarium euwallaceae TaxID=1147111 RepID=A0A430LAA1_9HYPO|nr:hypothetical protein BHE90_012946 [Fusarium euwallaceae]
MSFATHRRYAPPFRQVQYPIRKVAAVPRTTSTSADDELEREDMLSTQQPTGDEGRTPEPPWTTEEELLDEFLVGHGQEKAYQDGYRDGMGDKSE